MKFFRQTKETKRKLSFFLALAMVISLLPVSPVAKAASEYEKDITFITDINSVYVKSVANNGSLTGSAIVTLKVSDDAKKGKTIINLKAESVGTEGTTKAAIAVSDASISGPNTELAVKDTIVQVNNDGEATVQVNNIIKSMNTIKISGSWKEESSTDPEDPTTPTTVVTTVTDSAVTKEGIDKVSASVPDVKENLISNLNDSGLRNGKTREEVTKAINDGTAIITTAINVSALKDTEIIAAKNTVKNASTIAGLDSKVNKSVVSEMAQNGVVLNIDLESIIKIGETTAASIKMTELNGEVTVTMPIPNSVKELAKNASGKEGHYYVIRIHGNEVTIIPCDISEDGKSLSFKSNQFSTYIFTFKEGASIIDPSTPTPTPSGSNKPGNNNGYIPGPGQSSSPSSAPSANPSSAPSANPSGAPSATPSGAPSANPSGAPSANPSGAPTDPTNAPTEPTKAPVNPTKKPSASVKVGKKATISGSQYKVTAVKGTRTVQFTKGKKNAKKIVIPSTVKVSGKSYKVTTIAKNALKGNKKLTKLTIGANINKIGANAFKGCSKLKSIVVKTKKLTKSKVGANAFKGINAKATIKVPKAKVKAYKKIVKAKGAGKNVKVKK